MTVHSYQASGSIHSSWTRSLLTLSILAGSVLSGCSEEKGDGSPGSGANGSTGDGDGVVAPGDGDGDLVFGNGDGDGVSVGDGDGTSAVKDGGRQDLTPEQVAEIGSASCADWTGEGEPPPAVLQLVVDVSLSMSQPPSGMLGPGGMTKWDVTRDALADALDALPSNVSLGILYYPNMSSEGGTVPADVSTCVNVDGIVPIAPLGDAGSAHRTTVDQSLQTARVDSYTPTYDAYTYALSSSLLPYMDTPGDKFMLLITDGAPTFEQGCVNVGAVAGMMGQALDAPTEPIIAEIQSAFMTHNIRTFLIGSPGSERSSESGVDMRPWLSKGAMVGGTASAGCAEAGPNFCHLDMTQEPDFAQALTNGLRDVLGQIVDQCVFEVPTPDDGSSVDAETANLIINWGNGSSSLILPDEMGDCADGWHFNAQGQVELCATTCQDLQASNGASVDLTFGCTVDELIR